MLWPMLAFAASTAVPAAQADPVIATLTRCMMSAEPTTVDPGRTVTPPPGLHDDQVKVVAIDGSARQAFAYEGIRGLSCGIALYGKVPSVVRREIEAVVASVPGWRPFKPAPIRTAPPAREMGWGLGMTPTMYGAILLERRPSPAAPTIDVVRYAVLVP